MRLVRPACAKRKTPDGLENEKPQKLLPAVYGSFFNTLQLQSYSSADNGAPNKVIPYFSNTGASRLGSGGPLRLIGPNSS